MGLYEPNHVVQLQLSCPPPFGPPRSAASSAHHSRCRASIQDHFVPWSRGDGARGVDDNENQVNCVFFWNWGVLSFCWCLRGGYGLPTRPQWEPTRAQVEGSLPTQPTRMWFCFENAYAATVWAAFLNFCIQALYTWEGGWDNGNPTMQTSPIMVGWDTGSSCWTLGRETGIVEIPLWKPAP